MHKAKIAMADQRNNLTRFMMHEPDGEQGGAGGREGGKQQSERGTETTVLQMEADFYQRDVL